MDFDIFQVIGFIGMACVVWAYWLIQVGKITHDSLKYLWLNFAGAIFLIISLIVHFNLGSILIEIFWIGITIYGLIKAYKGKKNEI